MTHQEIGTLLQKSCESILYTSSDITLSQTVSNRCKFRHQRSLSQMFSDVLYKNGSLANIDSHKEQYQMSANFVINDAWSQMFPDVLHTNCSLTKWRKQEKLYSLKFHHKVLVLTMKNFLSKEKQIWGNRKVDVYLQGQTKCLNEKSVKKHRRREWFKTKRC